jgi:predicted permease
VETLWKDIRFGLRTLAKSPGFTAVAALTLALGIGANTALFSLVNSLLLRHLPVSHPEELVAVGIPYRVNSVSQGTPRLDLFSLPLYHALRENSRSFDGLLASGRTGQLDMRVEGAPANSVAEHPHGRLVSGNYFSLLGVRAAIGRTIMEDDDRAGGSSPPVMVISYDYWQRRFASDPAVLGRQLGVNGGKFTIVGVAAPGFFGEVVGAQPDFWIPASQQPLVNPGRNWVSDPQTSWLLLMGRLKPGVTLEQAQAELDPLVHRLIPTLPNVKLDADDIAGIAKGHVQVSPGGVGFSSVRARFSQPLLLLLGMVGVVLLICCANIANLMLTRAAARTREIGVRLAMGAPRFRLVRQLLTESLLLSLLGTACGCALAVWCTRLLLQLVSRGTDPIPLDVHADLRVLGFTLGICVLTAVFFGLAPALRAIRVDLISALKPSMGRTGHGMGHSGKFNAGKALVVAQVAVSLLLLTGAGLLVKSLQNLIHQDVGFDRNHLLIVETDPVTGGYDEKQMDSLMGQVSAALAELPGVTGVVTSYNGLFSGTDSATLLAAGDFQRTSRDDREAAYDMVGAEYFQTIGARILQGRGIEPRDSATSTKVAVIGQGLAQYQYAGVNPIGHYLQLGDSDHPAPVEIVGVVSDIKESELAGPPARRFFIPLTQRTDAVGYLRFIVRTAGDPAVIRKSVQARLAERYPNLRLLDASPVDQLMRQDITEQRVLAQLSSFFGGLALLLAVTGLYGVISYTTSLRTSEIGIRMALGAPSGTVLRMVLGESLGLLVAGIVLGGAIALAALRVLSSRLFGLSASDPGTFAIATLVLAMAVLLAGYLPARRASRVNPLVALHEE